MAGGGDAVDESKLKGLSRIFNAQTMRGRANVSTCFITWLKYIKKLHFIDILCDVSDEPNCDYVVSYLTLFYYKSAP